MRKLDLAGQRFGRLVVVDAVPGDGARWRCQCDCGGTCVVPGMVLRAGRSKSCGCLRREMGVARGKASRRHGEGSNGKESPEYRTWTAMLSRCENLKHASYPDYGARGIAVCERWHVYENFLVDMGRRPGGPRGDGSYSLDRIDNSRGYEPGNCRWATSREQNQNTRLNRKIEIDGTVKPLCEWLRHFGLSPRAFYYRMRKGLTEIDALRIPAGSVARLQAPDHQ